MSNPIANLSITADAGQTFAATAAVSVQPVRGAAVSGGGPEPGAAKASGTVDPVAASQVNTAPPPEVPGANLRLVIEDDKAAGSFVYKIINRNTGEVVQQLPTEQMLKLRESDGYAAGAVISAKV